MPNLPKISFLLLSLLLGIACLRYTDWILNSVIQINIDEADDERRIAFARSIIHGGGYILVSVFVMGVVIIAATAISP